jgi:hypothetical protein
MDETSIYLDFPTNYTYTTKGDKKVKSTTTGGGRVRISAAFTATASGIKLPILILVPRKTPLPNFDVPPNCCVIYKPSATFDENIICEFLEIVIKPYMSSNHLEKCAILLDAAKCHNTKIVQDKLKQLIITQVHIPPRMTNLLQPADVCWFRPLKSHYHRLWNESFLKGEHTFTRNDNARSPGYVKSIEWLSLMWDHFVSHNIINSFEFCGVVNQYRLHQALNHIVNKKEIINDYIDVAQSGDNIDGFDSDEEIFSEISEPHVLVTATCINTPQIPRSENLSADIIPSYQC